MRTRGAPQQRKEEVKKREPIKIKKEVLGGEVPIPQIKEGDNSGASTICTFCEIVGGRLNAQIHFEDNDVVVFENNLEWLPVMLLVVPRDHMTQTELWENGSLISKLGLLAVSLGNQHCPNGFRVLSNFGEDALQTQRHGHLHVLGGRELGLYVQPSKLPNQDSHN